MLPPGPTFSDKGIFKGNKCFCKMIPEEHVQCRSKQLVKTKWQSCQTCIYTLVFSLYMQWNMCKLYNTYFYTYKYNVYIYNTHRLVVVHIVQKQTCLSPPILKVLPMQRCNLQILWRVGVKHSSEKHTQQIGRQLFGEVWWPLGRKCHLLTSKKTPPWSYHGYRVLTAQQVDKALSFQNEVACDNIQDQFLAAGISLGTCEPIPRTSREKGS